jgi:hypothetical protein
MILDRHLHTIKKKVYIIIHQFFKNTYEMKVDFFLVGGIIFIQNKCKFLIALHTCIIIYEVWLKYYIYIFCQSYQFYYQNKNVT